jgi:hypothetical protein
MVDENTINCGICWNELTNRNVCTTECGHSFCLSCIMKNINYNNSCPYCRTELYGVEKKDDNIESEIDDEGEEEEHEDEDNDDNDFYSFPVIIENLDELNKVLYKMAACSTYQDNIGWMTTIISIMNDNINNDYFNFIDDETYNNYYLLPDNTKDILLCAIFIYKRSILLKKHFLNKIIKMNE